MFFITTLTIYKDVVDVNCFVKVSILAICIKIYIIKKSAEYFFFNPQFMYTTLFKVDVLLPVPLVVYGQPLQEPASQHRSRRLHMSTGTGGPVKHGSVCLPPCKT